MTLSVPRVQKYGGSSVASPAQIRSIAKKISEARKQGQNFIIIVSAMGDSTDELCALAQQISLTPNRRELDMLLSTGERVTMALMSMALNEMKCPAISFTGSQAGILTDSSHNNARITDIRPLRLEEELQKGNTIVLAGFQGVNPQTKEITTLGRGGSDLTAVAMAAHFKARECEILKDVTGVFSADPRIVPSAIHRPKLNFDHLLDITFWGASVLHYRSVELAARLMVPIRISLAHGEGTETLITGDKMSYEQNKIMSVNSHNTVVLLEVANSDIATSLAIIKDVTTTAALPWPQLLDARESNGSTSLLITAPQENLLSLKEILSKKKDIYWKSDELATVTVSCFGSITSDFVQVQSDCLLKAKISPRQTLFSPASFTFVIPKSQTLNAIRILHEKVSD